MLDEGDKTGIDVRIRRIQPADAPLLRDCRR
jgi:hypothetical protein